MSNSNPSHILQAIETNDSCIVQHAMQAHTFSVSKDKLESIRNSISTGNDELAFGFFLLSMGITSFCTLITTEIKNNTIHTLFCVAIIVGLLLGLFMVWKWWRFRKAARKIIDDILESPIERRKSLK